MKLDLTHSRNGILILAAAGGIAAGAVADRAYEVHSMPPAAVEHVGVVAGDGFVDQAAALRRPNQHPTPVSP